MKNKKLVAVIVVLIVAVALLFTYNNQSTDQSPEGEQIVKIGYLPLADHLPLMVASGNEMFEGVTVEPVKFTDWPSLVEALKSGNIDGAHIINTLAMKMISTGYEGEAVALSHRGAIALSATAGIADVEDIRGETIAVPTRFSPHFMMLHNYLSNNNIDPDTDVSILDVAPPDFVSTMASGQVAAFIGSEPFPTIANAKNVGETFKLWDEMQIEGTNGLDCVVVFSKDMIKEESKTVQAYVDGIVTAGNFIEEEPLNAATIASPFMLNIAPPLLVKAIDEPKHRGSYDQLTPVYEEFEAFQNYMIKSGLLNNPVNLDDFVNDSFAKSAYKNL